jgi:flagellar hook-basal body complex protein FliE
VVTAVDNAELMLQTVVAIRDKVINAYQSIIQTSV